MNSATKSWTDHGINYPIHDLAVVIGRFQPFHNGHMALIKAARKVAGETLILVGSTSIARNIKNPFTYDERVQMIKEALGDKEASYVSFAPLVDDLYSDQAWIATVQTAIDKAGPSIPEKRIVLVGHHKDASSYYLDMFPAFDFYEVPSEDVLNSTTVREIMFKNKMIPANSMPHNVAHFLSEWFMKTPQYKDLCEEYQFITEYKTKWANSPFQPVFVTTDAVVICQGHVLLVKRRMNPGKGLWALPGGFLGTDESIQDSTLRELDEETRIKVNKNLLRASIKDSRTFDHPERSLRGRTITHASLIVLENLFELPKVRGSDDAEKAKWIPLSKFYRMSDQMFEDHYSIISYMINRA